MTPPEAPRMQTLHASRNRPDWPCSSVTLRDRLRSAAGLDRVRSAST